MMANLDCHLVWIKRHLWDEVGHACEDVSRGNWTIQANKGLFIKDIIIGSIPWWSQNTMTFFKDVVKWEVGTRKKWVVVKPLELCLALASSCPPFSLHPTCHAMNCPALP